MKKRVTPFFIFFCLGLIAFWGSAIASPTLASAQISLGGGGNGGNGGGDNDVCPVAQHHDDGDHHDYSDHHSEGEHHDDGGDHHGDGDGDGHGNIGTFLINITNWAGGVITQGGGVGSPSKSVITLHRDKTLAAIDSNENSGVFSSQLGSWRHCGDGTKRGRTLAFSFGDGTITRFDYSFDKQKSKDTISGTLKILTFNFNDDPNGTGGTVIASLDFTGVRVQPSADKDNDDDKDKDQDKGRDKGKDKK
jgi:hypothetical protein